MSDVAADRGARLGGESVVRAAPMAIWQMRLLVTRSREDGERVARRLRAIGHEAVVAPMSDVAADRGARLGGESVVRAAPMAMWQMRLLVTRSREDGERFARRLRAIGHEAVVAPMIDVRFDDAAPLPDPRRCAALAFTSANGVRALMRRASVGSDLRDLPTFAVGSRTAAALRAGRWPYVHESGGEVAALIETIARFAAGGHLSGSVAHVAGRHRAGDLVAELAARGVPAARHVLYDARAVDACAPSVTEALKAGRFDGVFFHSRRGAALFANVLRAALGESPSRRRPAAYCLSEGIAATAAAAGFAVAVARRCDEEGLLALVAPPGG